MSAVRLPIPPSIRELSGLRHEGFVRSWRKPAFVTGFLILFCLIWNGSLVWWYALAHTMEGTPAIMLWFPLLHVAIGLGLTYFIVATIFNRTEFLVDGSTLSVKHRPLPWRGSRDIPKAEISQIFITESYSHRRRGEGVHYAIHWMNHENQAQRLLGGIGDRGEAIYIERKLEELLGIKSEAVLGEMNTEPSKG